MMPLHQTNVIWIIQRLFCQANQHDFIPDIIIQNNNVYLTFQFHLFWTTIIFCFYILKLKYSLGNGAKRNTL